MVLKCAVSIIFIVMMEKASCKIGEEGVNMIKYRLKAATGDYAFQKDSTVLLAVPTANVLHRTHSLLISLSSIEDSFDLLIVDELSTDGTIEHLKQRKIKFVSPEKPSGVTHNWNMAFEYFMANDQYNILFISNNDVLIPNGVIDELAQSLQG
eukprot:TRINITY_DN2039_c0_g1_i14.p3 TRINITY_DN2039_c0_g1~~TRINITY_DN2039_c0_g1_i14.p3  ORF type:complete len:153 (+),score=18.66 TRINITY_DN2039_c0_g1_i14:118-576(+)